MIPDAAEPALEVAWLGRAGYRPVWELQERLRRTVLSGDGPETLLLVEHDPVITLGRSANPAHVLASDEALRARGVERIATTRGGDVTYHGPGQLVAYPVVRLRRGVVAHVEAMARAVIDVVAELGVSAEYRRGCPGVWVGDRKLCALGVNVHRRVAIHGLALNVTTSSEAFSLIVACGLPGPPPVSLRDLIAEVPPVEALSPILGRALARRFGLTHRALPSSRIPSLLSPPPSVE